MAALTACTALVAGCGGDTAPDWGYPELGKSLRSLNRDVDGACGPTETPESCAEDLDRLTAPTERAFAQVLEHKLLDVGTVAAMNELDRARELRAAAAEEARSRQDPHHLPLARAVAAEKLAYQRLLDELERLRTAPPPGDGTDPV
ncbi:hypothetical protein OG594_41120 [Streptomyces sp. NBC_01214]|uniref:hypothetical protein n=1 Tax=Streptomyces sp. NBC_01214 TaxID=2903777 RepID=UPI00225C07C9|nr:hypothetical protein [Streptomyces sp. NBC_01214]MCX4807926.1 hypothetical protein [Streptomyces sp. NBC_01214]